MKPFLYRAFALTLEHFKNLMNPKQKCLQSPWGKQVKHTYINTFHIFPYGYGIFHEVPRDL